MVFVDFRSVLKVSGKGVSLPFERPSRVTLFFKWNNSSLSPTQQTVRQTETDCASPHFFCLVLVLPPRPRPKSFCSDFSLHIHPHILNIYLCRRAFIISSSLGVFIKTIFKIYNEAIGVQMCAHSSLNALR